MAAVHRTDPARREGLPDYPFAPHHVEIVDAELGPLRVHYLDEGPRSAPTVVLLHGEPSWSYLYRHMIPPLADAGLRVLAPDLVGFGFSDKPTSTDVYSYARHVAWLTAWFEAVDPQGVTLFCQDWGGLLGLCVVAGQPQRFARVMAANTALPEGGGEMPEAFAAWRKFAATSEDLPVGQILQGGTVRTLSDAEMAAYDAPFDRLAAKAGARVFPALVPIEPDAPGVAVTRAAWQVLETLEIPFATAFSDQDPVTAGMETSFRERIPGAARAPHRRLAGGGHFLQEDVPGELAEALLAFVRG